MEGIELHRLHEIWLSVPPLLAARHPPESVGTLEHPTHRQAKTGARRTSDVVSDTVLMESTWTGWFSPTRRSSQVLG